MFPFTAVGVGPGDPELITLKGARLIREADVVVTPVAEAGGASIARTIVGDLVDSSRQEVVCQVFPMSRNPEELEALWARAAREVAGWVREGKRVVFVTLGDPSLYSTFLYLRSELKESFPEVPVEIVPGISSIHTAAALTGIPLALSDDRLAILPATRPEKDLTRALTEFETVVLMKVHRSFPRIRSLLRDAGLLKSSIFVRRAGLPGQTVTGDLEDVREADLDYLSLILVRRPA